MKAKDIVPGVYAAHGASDGNCTVHSVMVHSDRILISFSYSGKELSQWAPPEEYWALERYFDEYVIEEWL